MSRRDRIIWECLLQMDQHRKRTQSRRNRLWPGHGSDVLGDEKHVTISVGPTRYNVLFPSRILRPSIMLSPFPICRNSVRSPALLMFGNFSRSSYIMFPLAGVNILCCSLYNISWSTDPCIHYQVGSSTATDTDYAWECASFSRKFQQRKEPVSQISFDRFP